MTLQDGDLQHRIRFERKVIARDRDIPAVAEDGSVWLSWDPADTISVPDKLAS